MKVPEELFSYDPEMTIVEEILTHHHDYNCEDCDGRPCVYCGGEIELMTKNGRIDRSNRVDCDKANSSYSCLESYHVRCWIKAVCEL